MKIKISLAAITKKMSRAMIAMVVLCLSAGSASAAADDIATKLVIDGTVNPKIMIFISSSMPDDILKRTLKMAANYQVPVFVRDLVDGDLTKTIDKIADFSKSIPLLSIQFDIEKFKKYHVSEVPAIVVACDHDFSVRYNKSIQAIDSFNG